MFTQTIGRDPATWITNNVWIFMNDGKWCWTCDPRSAARHNGRPCENIEQFRRLVRCDEATYSRVAALLR